MKDKERAKRFAEEVSTNPLLATAFYGLSGAVLGLGWAAMNNTPEKRQRFKEMQAQYRRDRARREQESRQFALRYRLQESYFKEGLGKDLYQQRAYIVVPAGAAFPDTHVRPIPAGMGGSGFEAASASAGLRLSASYNAYDGRGSFRLDRPDGSFRKGESSFSLHGLVVYPDEDPDTWLDDARLMARLIATSGTHCRQIELLRPNHADIREAIWREYLQDNPHIASAIGDG